MIHTSRQNKDILLINKRIQKNGFTPVFLAYPFGIPFGIFRGTAFGYIIPKKRKGQDTKEGITKILQKNCGRKKTGEMILCKKIPRKAEKIIRYGFSVDRKVSGGVQKLHFCMGQPGDAAVQKYSFRTPGQP